MFAYLITMLLAISGKHAIASLEMQDQTSLPSMCIQGCCGLPDGVKLSLPGTQLECCPCKHKSPTRFSQSSDSSPKITQEQSTSLGYEKNQATLATESSINGHMSPQANVEVDSQTPLQSPQETKPIKSDQILKFCDPPGPWCYALSSIINNGLTGVSEHARGLVQTSAKEQRQSSHVSVDKNESSGNGFCEGANPPLWCEFVLATLSGDISSPSSSPQSLKQNYSQVPITNDETVQESANTNEGSKPPSWYTIPLAIQISSNDYTSQICGLLGCKPSDEVMKDLSTALALVTGAKKVGLQN
ncbi:MAG: hypothetical protein M1822_004219 [Bathelium mastoideum]|nr:MAG: hypothetical protein M1822_004219 [Bathelium mastoideum]